MSLEPTEEQVSIVHGFRSGEQMVIEAGAGTGKTSTLSLIGLNAPFGARGLYVAYNKAIVTESQGKFPPGIQCRTAHSLAYGVVGYHFKDRIKHSARLPIHMSTKIIGAQEVHLDDRRLSANLVTSLALEAVREYCNSADTYLSPHHVIAPQGLTMEQRDEVRRAVLPYAIRAWEDLIKPDGGRLRFDHGVYLKLYQLSDPVLPCNYVMLDEAQDANPVIAAIVANQTHCQKIMVGDSAQSIYGWNGAIDALTRFRQIPGTTRYLLSQSFRFGPQVAAEAAKWLQLAGSDLNLRGWGQLESRVDTLDDFGPDGHGADVILCRTNAGVMENAMDAIRFDIPTAVVGGGQEIRDMAVAAKELQAGRRAQHPQLVMFTSWSELGEHVRSGSGDSDLKVLVQLVDKYGADTLIKTVDSLVPEPVARLTLSTAHKAKGREWAKVKVHDDFMEPQPSEKNPDPRVAREDAMLAYVTVTRAREVLDRGGLGWVDNWVKMQDEE